MTPLVSVVLPARNAAGSIAQVVHDTRAQTFEAWELLVVDDGSDDGTGVAAADAAHGDPRVQILEQPHRGIVASLSAGIAAARGACIARMDADDRMAARRLQTQVELLQARPDVGVVACLVEFGGNTAAARGYALHVEWINTLREPDEIARHRFIESPVAHPSVMFRRELVDRHGGYREGAWPEDYELWLRWMEAGVRFVIASIWWTQTPR